MIVSARTRLQGQYGINCSFDIHTKHSVDHNTKRQWPFHEHSFNILLVLLPLSLQILRSERAEVVSPSGGIVNVLAVDGSVLFVVPTRTAFGVIPSSFGHRVWCFAVLLLVMGQCLWPGLQCIVGGGGSGRSGRRSALCLLCFILTVIQRLNQLAHGSHSDHVLRFLLQLIPKGHRGFPSYSTNTEMRAHPHFKSKHTESAIMMHECNEIEVV